MRKIIIFTMCVIIISYSIVYAVSFTDLPETHWAYANITKLVEEGVINGYPDGTYRPDGTVTRGEFLKLILVAALGEEYKNEDSSSHWAEQYRKIAVRNGLLMKNVEEHELNESITRLEMAVILAKTHISFKGKIGTIHTEKYEFEDISNIDEEYKLYIEYISLIGLIKGYEDKTFRPDSYMNRAEVATVIYRYLNN